MKKFKNVKVIMETIYFDIEMTDKEYDAYKTNSLDDCDILKEYLEDNYQEYEGLLSIADVEGEIEDDWSNYKT